MPFLDMLLATRLADLERERETATAMRRTLAELYGRCRCAPRGETNAATCERHAVDPGLFRRFVWSGLGA